MMRLFALAYEAESSDAVFWDAPSDPTRTIMDLNGRVGNRTCVQTRPRIGQRVRPEGG
jgi:hypothetical protein